MLMLLWACAPKVNDPADVQAIKDTQPAFDKVWNARNADAVVSGIYTTEAIRMEPNQPALVGQEAIRTSLQKYFAQYSDESRDVAEDVRVTGNLAVARGTFEGKSSLKAGGYAAQVKGKWVTAFERQADGTWKAFWDIYNTDLPVADSLAPGAEEQALLQIEQDWAEALRRADAAALDRILAPGFVENFDGQLTAKAKMVADVKAGVYKVQSLDVSDMKALVLGDRAAVNGITITKQTTKGKDSSGTYRWTDVFEKRGGRWSPVVTYLTIVK